MGIPKFFGYCNKNFIKSIYRVEKDETFNNFNINIDTLMLDLNGIFHTSAQKIYGYGNYKIPVRILGEKRTKKNLQEKMFEDVCLTIDYIFNIVNPQKDMVLCVDGPAPIAKQNQQRQRRYRSSIENVNSSFDTCNITPGTQFMDYLSKYIDWYIKKRITENEKWKNVNIIFSNEKSPGEGEHKLINYIRKYGKDEDTYCLYGLDADLIMLALGTHKNNFYILRDDLYDKTNKFFIMNIGEIRDELKNKLDWRIEDDNISSFFNNIKINTNNVNINTIDIMEFNGKYAINDFIFFCFIIGNDFLPHIPSMEIIEGGIDIMFDVYKNVCKYYGHLTYEKNDNVLFNKKSLDVFLGTISLYEQYILEKKLTKRESYFKDELLEKNCKFINEKLVLNINDYRNDYIKSLFPENTNEKDICHKYLEGMQWVLTYYTRGISNWEWYYPYYYAPFAHHLCKHIASFNFPDKVETKPNTPFQQLLSVLPPKSANLIPQPLCKLLTDNDSPLISYCPNDIKIDLSGKQKEWEAVILVPFMDQKLLSILYNKYIVYVNQNDMKRNILGKTFIYKYSPTTNFIYKSYYGNIENCKTTSNIIDL